MLRKIFTILAILASIGVIVVTQTKLRQHIQGIIDQRETNAKEREQQRARANGAEKTLASTSNELVSTTATLKSTTSELESTKANLATASSARDKALADLEKSKDAEKAARQNLAQWDALGMKAEDVKIMKDDFGKAKDANLALTEEAKVLQRQIVKLTNELARLMGGDNYEAPLPPGLKGTILVVDPRWEFVVLDIGENKQVLKDGVMMVHRNSKLVGKVRITNVMAERSIANVMPGWKLDEIREGDQVLY